MKKFFLPLIFNYGREKKAVKLKAFLWEGTNNEKEKFSFLSLVSLKNFSIGPFTQNAEISSLPLFFICLHPIKVQEVLKLASRQLPLDKDLHFKQIRCFHLLNLLPPARPEKCKSSIEKRFSHSSEGFKYDRFVHHGLLQN